MSATNEQAVSNLREWTQSQLLDRLYKLFLFMDLIKKETHWATVAFNETTLQNIHVDRKLAQYEQSTDAELTARWEAAGFAGIVVVDGIPTMQQAAA